MSQLSISGAISGLDTATLISQLVAVDGQRQQAVKNRQSAAQKAADAYSTLITSLSGLADKATALATTSSWKGSVATSSAASVSTSVTGTPSGSLTFAVTSVAAAHALVSDATVSGLATVVASSSLSVLDRDGATVATLDVGGGTLAEVVAAINADSSLGLRATAVQTSPGQYKLQVASTTTGEASRFSLAGITLAGGMEVLAEGTDAAITVGTNPSTQYTVTSGTNTFKDLVAGLDVTVSALESSVTVSATVDGSSVADSVSALVDAANGILADLAKATAYGSGTASTGALVGDGTIRRLQQEILSAVGGASAPGVQLTRGGRLTFDRSAFLTAFAADPGAVAGAFGARVDFDATAGVAGTVTLQRSTTGAREGHYAVQAAVAAAREQWQVTPSGSLEGQTIVILQGSLMVSYTIGVGQSLSDAVAAVNARAAAAGIGVGAAVNHPSIVFTAASAGAGSAFTAQLNGTDGTRVQAGTDVQGTIDGRPATGVGSILTLNDAASGANGLSLNVAVSSADIAASGGDLGTVDYRPGLASRLAATLSAAVDPRAGSLTQAKASRLDDVSDLQTEIDAWNVRLETRRATLQRQFTAMETALAALQSQTSALTGLITS